MTTSSTPTLLAMLRVRPNTKALSPAEHGLWAWVTVPLVAALLLAPHPATLLAGAAVVGGFLASNAAARWLRRKDAATGLAALWAAAATGLATLGALAESPAPLVLAGTLGAAGLAAAAVALVTRGRFARTLPFEAAGLVGLTGLGAGLALSSGATPDAVAAVFVTLLAWQALGVAYVQRALATVLAHRTADAGRAAAAGLSVVAAVAVGWLTGHLWVGLLPLAYALRVLAHRPATSAKDAKRVGLAELAWSLALVVAAVALA